MFLIIRVHVSTDFTVQRHERQSECRKRRRKEHVSLMSLLQRHNCGKSPDNIKDTSTARIHFSSSGFIKPSTSVFTFNSSLATVKLKELRNPERVSASQTNLKFDKTCFRVY